MSATAREAISLPTDVSRQLVTGRGERLGLLYYLKRGTSLPPEVEEGNVEYKLKLLPSNDQRKNQLTSQLQWRLTEHGECYYMLGYVVYGGRRREFRFDIHARALPTYHS